jgi:hypothetical protein
MWAHQLERLQALHALHALHALQALQAFPRRWHTPLHTFTILFADQRHFDAPPALLLWRPTLTK